MILTPKLHPRIFEDWSVLFRTKGRANLKVIPQDSATIEDLKFISLKCGNEKRIPSIIEGKIVFYPNWSCDEISTLNNYVQKAGNHHLVFEFSDLYADAFNAAKTWDGGGDGSSWSGDNNWNPDGVPGVDDDVTIDANVTVNISATTTINSLTLGNSGGSTTPTLNFSYNAITNGALIIDDGDLTVYSGAIITHSSGTTVVVGTVYIDVQTGDATLAGTVNLDSKGYEKSAGTGEGTNGSALTGGGGAGYGGEGGDYPIDTYGGPVAGGVAYGSISQPVDLGSGGGNTDASNSGGAGGGAIKLNVAGAATISGTITANGTNAPGTFAGGGSGGSIYLTANSFAGSGTIRSNGGNGKNTIGGGGAGGRIALYYTADGSSLTITAYGGTGSTYGFGGAGTIYKRDIASASGNLLVDNNNKNPSTSDAFIGRTKINSTESFDTITLQNYGNLETGSSTNITYNTLNWSTKGIITDGGGTFALLSSGGNVTVPSTAILFANTARTFSNLIIEGDLTHTKNTFSETYKIDLIITNDLTINGTVTLDYKGYWSSTGTGEGIDSANGAGGAGYGGTGGAGKTGAGGSSYGLNTIPTNIGSGGGRYSSQGLGGAGGGAVKFNVGDTATIAGTISANGQNGQYALGTGGGSGGSIYIITGILEGAGTVRSNGGNRSGTDGGGGAGGRIAFYYLSDISSISPTVAGGTGYNNGSAGTIYTELTNQSPIAPDSLLTEGETNPACISDTTPELSAIYNDSDAGDIANKYRIQVDDDELFGSSIWDSGVGGTGMSDCNQGSRCQDISYTGDPLSNNVKYYWHIKFWDDTPAEGVWSTESAYFTIKKVNADSCTLDSECCSGFCTDGYCCENACNGTCQRCDATPGTCTVRILNDNAEVITTCQYCNGVNPTSQPYTGNTGVNCTADCDSCIAGACTTRLADDNTECDTCQRCDGTPLVSCNLVSLGQEGKNCDTPCKECNGAGNCVDIDGIEDTVGINTCAGPCRNCLAGACDIVTCGHETIGTVCSGQNICDDLGNCVAKAANGNTCRVGACPICPFLNCNFCASGYCSGNTCFNPSALGPSYTPIPITSTCYGNVIGGSGGEVSCTFQSGNQVKTIFSEKSIEGTVVVRIDPKDKTEIIKNNPLPKNYQIVGDLIANLRAFSESKELEAFKEKVTITFSYKDEGITGANLDENTLKIYWWDEVNNTWQGLESKVDTNLNTVTANTSHFTYFALVGEQAQRAYILELQRQIIKVLLQLIQILQTRLNEILGI